MTRSTRALLYVVYLVIIVGLGAAIYSSYDKERKASPPQISKAPAASQGVAPAPVAPAAPAAPQAAPTKPNKKTPPTSAGSQVGRTGGRASSDLANTGPGDTLGVVAVVSIGSALAYRRLLIRKLA